MAEWTIATAARALRSGELTPESLVTSCLEQIEAGRELNAFISVLADEARAAARAAGENLKAGRDRGPLHGIPVSIKDLVDVAGTNTTSGSKVPPRRAQADAPIVERLRAAGAIVIGKTNLHEFAFGTTSDESGFGAVHHPLDPSRSPGGSSGGAAVALVTGMCLGSVGTDTGGSIRIPSAACGTVGLKPSYGELPCDGVVPLSTTCDHVGPMTRTLKDAALMFAAMGGAVAPQPPATRRLTIGIPEPYFCERLDPAVRRALDRTWTNLAADGHDVRPVSVRHAEWTPSVYLHIVLPEASCYHAPMLQSHPDGYSPGVRMRLEMGRYVLAEDYVRAMRLREILRQSVNEALAGLDALLLPTLPIVAPPIGAASVDVDGHKEPVRAAMLRLTQLFNITGHPSVALPAGADGNGLPVGLQLVGAAGQTAALLDTASIAEPYIVPGLGSVGGGTG